MECAYYLCCTTFAVPTTFAVTRCCGIATLCYWGHFYGYPLSPVNGIMPALASYKRPDR